MKNNETDNLFNRVLRIVYLDKNSSFKIYWNATKMNQFIQWNCNISLKNIELKSDLFLEIIKNLFFSTYSLRSGEHFSKKNMQIPHR